MNKLKKKIKLIKHGNNLLTLTNSYDSEIIFPIFL